MTKRTVENIASLHPQFRVIAEAFVETAQAIAAKHGATVEVLSGTRSWKQQEALYAQGRTKPGPIVTKARPGSSWHNYGLALDLGLFKNHKYLDEAHPTLARLIYCDIAEMAAKPHGLEWAGTWKRFPETPHFQKTYGLTLAELAARMSKCGYDVDKLKLD